MHRDVHPPLVLRGYYFVTFVSFGVFLPFLPPWLDSLGIRGAGLGAVTAVRPILAVFSPVIFGIAADRLGLRGALLRMACIGAGLAMGTLALLPGLGIPLTFGSVLIGMSVFAFFRAPMVSIADVAALERERARYGSTRLFGSAGFLIAALSAGYLLDLGRPSAFPAVIALAMFTAAAISFGIPGRAVRAPAPRPGEMRRLLASRGFRLFLATAFLWLFSHAAYDICLSLHLRDLGASGRVVGWAWAIGVLFEIGLLAISPALVVRFSPPGLMAVALLAMAIRWGAMSLCADYRLLLALQPCHALSFALFWVGAVTYVGRRAPEGMLATAQGLFSAASSLGGGLSMLLWGPLYEAARGVGVFGAASAVGVIGFAVSLKLKREPFLREEDKP